MREVRTEGMGRTGKIEEIQIERLEDDGHLLEMISWMRMKIR